MLVMQSTWCHFILSLSIFELAHGRMIWGTATAAYQVEGSRNADGRQLSVWDAFDTPEASQLIKARKPNGQLNVFGGENAAKADSDYEKFFESSTLTKDLGFNSARFSISWPRVMNYSEDPKTGKLVASINEKGIAHYRKVLLDYRQRGLQAAVTMWHWDTPLAIEEHAARRGCESVWLCHTWFPQLFADYANLLFANFGDLVEWWITINEPLTVVGVGYAGSGTHAPGRCSNRDVCWAGDDLVEPYMAAKGFILAHARAFRTWERMGRPGRGCGMACNGDWRIPFTDAKEDLVAATRSLEFQAPLFFDPVYFGRWPASVQRAVGRRLPEWTASEVALIKGSHDSHFFMNSYTTGFARARPDYGCGWYCDPAADVSGVNWTSGVPVGTASSNGWLFNYGKGFGDLITWYNKRWPGLRFIVTENGWGSASSTMEDELERDDLERCNFYRDYIGNLSAVAVQHNISIDGYFAWSLLDNYEWADGFSVRFGLTYVDFNTGKRTPKMTARWFQKFITPLNELPKDGKQLPPCDKDSLADASGKIIKAHIAV